MSINDIFYPWVLSAALLLSTGPAVSFADNHDDITSNYKTPDISELIVQPPPAAENIKDINMEDPDPFGDADGIYFFHQAMGKAWQKAGEHINQNAAMSGMEDLNPIILQSSTLLGPFEAMYIPANDQNSGRLIFNTKNYYEFGPDSDESPADVMERLSDAVALDMIVFFQNLQNLQKRKDPSATYLFSGYSVKKAEKNPQNESAISKIMQEGDLRFLIHIRRLHQENGASPE